MTDKNPMAAEILETSSSGFAAAAAAHLERRLTLAAGEATAWREHLRQRVLELAAAVRVGRPELFARRIAWLRRARLARGLDDTEITHAFESLSEALAEELPAMVSESVRAPLDLARSELEGTVEPESEALSAADPAGRLGLEYIAACLDAEPQRATELILGALEDGMAPQSLLSDVLLPAQKEVGQLWHVGDISIAEEHLVTETTLRTMARIAGRSAPRQRSSRRMLAASVAGNAHDLGLRVVSDLYALAGWQCLFLGANVPADDLARAVQAYGVDLVVLTATLTTQIGALSTTIAEIRRQAPAARILVGGPAFDDSPEIWRDVGADAFAPRVHDAVAIGEQLVAAD